MPIRKENNFAATTFCILIISISAFRYISQLVDVFAHSPFFDFGLYHIYSDIASKGINPFDPNIVVKAGGIAQAANYPPLFYALMNPFTKISFEVASRIWFVLNQVYLVFVVVIIFRIVKNSLSLINITGIVFLIANFFPIYASNFLGQANIFVLFILTLSLYAFKHKHLLVAALLIALATHVKIQYMFFLPVFFVVGYRKLFNFALFFSLLGWLLAFVTIGLEQNLGYLKYVSNFPKELYLWVGNISIIANILRYIGLSRFSLLFVSMVVLVFFVGVIKHLSRNKNKFGAAYVWSISIIGTLICSPLLEIHHLAVCFLPIVWLLLSYQKIVFEKKDIYILIVSVTSIFLIGIWVFVSPSPLIEGWDRIMPLMLRTFGLLGLFWTLVQSEKVFKLSRSKNE